MLREITLVAGLIFSGVGTALAACPGQTGKPIFTDDFSDASGGWDADPAVTFVPGAMQIKTAAPATAFGFTLNLTFNAVEGDYCAVFVFPAEPPPPGNFEVASLIFLAKDYHTFFRANIFSNSNITIVKSVANNNSTLFQTLNFPAINTKPGSENAIRAVVKNQRVTIYVNGSQVTSVRAQLVDGNNRFGVVAGEMSSQAPSTIAKGRVYPVKLFSVTEAP